MSVGHTWWRPEWYPAQMENGCELENNDQGVTKESKSCGFEMLNTQGSHLTNWETFKNHSICGEHGKIMEFCGFQQKS